MFACATAIAEQIVEARIPAGLEICRPNPYHWHSLLMSAKA
jgi:hypothetical protein